MSTQRIVLVTGANGALGVHVVEALVGNGWRVLALHRGGAEIDGLEGLDCVRVQADVLDFAGMRDACPPRLDAVVHCAGNSSLWRRSGPEQLRVNVRGTRNVVRLALAHHASRFVHISCAAAFGSHSGKIREDTPRCGRSSPLPLIRSKAMAEIEVERGQRNGLDTVTLHPGFLIGAHDRHNWARLARMVASRRLPGMPSGGASFCATENVAHAVARVLEQGRPKGARWVLGDVSASYAGLAREIGRQLGHRRLLKPVQPFILNAYASLEEAMAPLFGREPDLTRAAVTLLSNNTYCDASRARRELEMPPQSLEAMVERFLDWLRRNKQI